jgi:hypothetical protein
MICLKTYISFGLLLMAVGCSRGSGSSVTTPSPTPTPTPTATVNHYTAGMDGIRFWRCIDSANLRYPYNGRDTVVYFNDTFGFTISNDSVIKRVYSATSVDSFTYVSTDSAAGTHYFTGIRGTGGWEVFTKIWYHWSDNSILEKSSGSGPGSTYMGQYERITRSTP